VTLSATAANAHNIDGRRITSVTTSNDCADLPLTSRETGQNLYSPALEEVAHSGIVWVKMQTKSMVGKLFHSSQVMQNL